MEASLPDWRELHRRYDESVTFVSGVDPLLGFNLRSKDFIRPFFRSFHQLTSQHPQAAIVGQSVNEELLSLTESALSEAILRVSRRLSLLTWYRVRLILRRN